MVHAYMAEVSLTALYILLVAAILIASEVGRWLGRSASVKGVEDNDASTLATATLGLLALLIAFTYSISLQRYDVRRQAILEEANAIGSVANYALMVPGAQQASTLGLLRAYTRVRIGLGAPFDPAKFERDVVSTADLQGKLWQQAVAAAAAAPQSLPVASSFRTSTR